MKKTKTNKNGINTGLHMVKNIKVHKGFADLIFGKKEEVVLRLERIEHSHDNKSFADTIIKENRRLAVLLMILVLVITCFSIFSLKKDNDFVINDKKGNIVAIKRPKSGEKSFTLQSKLTAINDREIFEKDLGIYIEAEKQKKEINKSGKNDSEEILIESKIDVIVRGFNNDLKEKFIKLPKTLDDGTKLIWRHKKNSNIPLAFFIGVLGLCGIYLNKYRKIKKLEDEASSSIKAGLPKFVNKMVLLLQGGMVFSQAYEKIIMEYKNSGLEDYFFNQLDCIETSVKEGNCILEDELFAFARRSRNMEFIRIVAIMKELSTKGSKMLDNLAIENEALWFSRKKDAEERGRISDTKLTFPLTIDLLVLVIVTVSPAFLDM